MAKTFIAKITPKEVLKGDTTKGVRYSKMPEASIEKTGPRGKPMTIVRTVMAFGRSNAAVANILRAGKTVELECMFDGGTVRIVGKSPKLAKAA